MAFADLVGVLVAGFLLLCAACWLVNACWKGRSQAVHTPGSRRGVRRAVPGRRRVPGT
jgi:hypothetical protein